MNHPPNPIGSMDATATNAAVASPCVRLCVLTVEGICMGCHRASGEIGRWGQADDAEKRIILKACNTRRFKAAAAGAISPVASRPARQSGSIDAATSVARSTSQR